MRNNTLRATSALAVVAAREGVSLREVEKGVQEAIDAAWSDPAAREAQMRLFPKGKPTPAEFVAVLSREAGRQAEHAG